LGGYPLPLFFKSHEGSSHAIQESSDENIDPLRHACLRQRRADTAARALKFYAFEHGHAARKHRKRVYHE
jgi:hypothetical protein